MKKSIKDFNKNVKENIAFFGMLIELAKMKILEEEEKYEIMNGVTIDGKELKRYKGSYRGLIPYIKEINIEGDNKQETDSFDFIIQ